jgi:hypothetical protein
LSWKLKWTCTRAPQTQALTKAPTQALTQAMTQAATQAPTQTDTDTDTDTDKDTDKDMNITKLQENNNFESDKFLKIWKIVY